LRRVARDNPDNPASGRLDKSCVFIFLRITVVNRWDEKAGLRRDAVGSQVIDALEAQEIKETGNGKNLLDSGRPSHGRR
jgi:hypothetical protein